MMGRWLDTLLWLWRVTVIVGVPAGCMYMVVEALPSPFGEWVRVEFMPLALKRQG